MFASKEPARQPAAAAAPKTPAVTPAATPADGFRVGIGTDLHRLQEGRALVLGGVKILSPVGAVGHSDADVVLHALADALLGAVAAGDIGQLFPDSDPRNQGLDSARILEKAVQVARELGFRPINVDVVVHLEAPKLAPHQAAMRARIAELLGVEAARVSVKAKTGEKLGPIGEGRAVSARAVALLGAAETGARGAR